MDFLIVNKTTEETQEIKINKPEKRTD